VIGDRSSGPRDFSDYKSRLARHTFEIVRLRQGFGVTASKPFGDGSKGITLPLCIRKCAQLLDFTCTPSGFGGKGIRTPDFQLAKLALYQLSYAPL
jgi:hypothetical protein